MPCKTMARGPEVRMDCPQRKKRARPDACRICTVWGLDRSRLSQTVPAADFSIRMAGDPSSLRRSHAGLLGAGRYSAVDGASDESATSEVGPSARPGQDVERRGVRVRHFFSRDHWHAIEHGAGAEVGKTSPVGCGMAATDFERDSRCKLYAHDVVTSDRG